MEAEVKKGERKKVLGASRNAQNKKSLSVCTEMGMFEVMIVPNANERKKVDLLEIKCLRTILVWWGLIM